MPLGHTPATKPSLPDYFFINSNTALVIPMMPTRIVGSGTGANLLECTLGSGVPVFLLSAIFAGSTAPMKKSQAGIEWSGRLYSEKSSETITGSIFSILSAPSSFFHTATNRLVRSGLL